MSSTRKTSVIWKVENEVLQKILNESNSYSDVLRHFSLDPHNGNHRTLSARIKFDSLDTSKISENRKGLYKSRKFDSRKNNDLIFIVNSEGSRGNLKRRILEGDLIEYKCPCGITDTWQGLKITLQLDHKNGVNNDDRLENLQFLCPNCHSQTKTFGSKNSKKVHLCPICSNEYPAAGPKCVKCYRESMVKKFEVEREKLFEMVCVQRLPLTSIGKIFGVSDNAIRKRCKKLNIVLTNPKSGV